MPEYPHWTSDQQERWLQELHPDGILELDDGSLWKPAPRSELTAAAWIRFSSITVSCEVSSTGVYCYTLLNTSYGQQVSAVYIGNSAESQAFGVA